MSKHRGSCLCGGVTFAVQGDFDSFYLCHCRHCQKDTGSAHAANLFSRSASLTWSAGESLVHSFTLPGTRHSKSFCKSCGSALPSIQAEALLVVPAGCLDTDVATMPTAHIFTASRPGWDRASAAVPEFAGLPSQHDDQ